MASQSTETSTELLEENEDTQRDKYLTFHIDTEEYGIEIRYVTEIIGIQKITPVPEMPEHLKGVINLRGKIIPVMDVRLRFRIPARAYDERTCVVVVNVRDTAVGLVVDRVAEVLDIPESQVEAAASLGRAKSNAFLSGIGKIGDKIKILLDVNRLLYDEDWSAVAAAHQDEEPA